MKGLLLPSLLYLCWNQSIVSADNEIFSVHGSGTTNPSKCIWHIMSLFEQRSRVPIQLTYRAVGSTTGQEEFLGVNNTDGTGDNMDPLQHIPYSDFGAGDIPIKTEAWNQLNEAINGDPETSAMVHLPFVVSAVSFFHNVHDIDGNMVEVKLTPCLIAKIFRREITTWDDDEILKENEVLKGKLQQDYDILVARRVKGSSSTKSITQYLHRACPSHWPLEMVASKMDPGPAVNNWHPDTTPCEGSGGMTACITGTSGSIGYIDSGHGWEVGLTEVELQNLNGNFITSKEARAKGGIAEASVKEITPDRVDEDWGGVNLINKSGENTWPIVVQSYVYIRKNIHSYVENDIERGLLKLFVESLYDSDYIGICREYGFEPVASEIKEKALKGINDLVAWDFPLSDKLHNPWIFEKETKPFIGQGPYVISHKRRTYNEYAISRDDAVVENMLQDVEALLKLIDSNGGDLPSGGSGDSIDYDGPHDVQFTNLHEGQLDAALVLSAISFSLWCIVILAYFLKTKVLNI